MGVKVCQIKHIRTCRQATYCMVYRVWFTSKYIDKLIVSTDNQQIADIAKFIGAEVPFLRPDSISTDESPTIDTLIHAINYLKNINQNYHYLALLEPTSPLRDVSDIDIPIEVLEKKRKIADSIVGVCKTESTHPAFSLEIHKKGLIKPFQSHNFSMLRRQELSELFFFEGSIYISDIDVLIEQKTFYHSRTLAHVVPRWKSIEIDEMSDFIIAEAFIKNRHKLEL